MCIISLILYKVHVYIPPMKAGPILSYKNLDTLFIRFDSNILTEVTNSHIS